MDQSLAIVNAALILRNFYHFLIIRLGLATPAAHFALHPM